MQRYRTELGAVTFLSPGDPFDEVTGALSSPGTVAVDTETTGLDPYAVDFELRLVQVGTPREAWAIDSRHPELPRLFETRRPMWAHNRTYDGLTAETAGLTDWHTFASHTRDTATLSRVLDPRPEHMGGTGHSLDALGRAYLGVEDKGEAKKALMAAGRKLKLRKQADVWRHVPVDTPEYVIYGAKDTILTARLADALDEQVRRRGLSDVVDLEHRIAYELAYLTRKGIAFDREWSERAWQEYDAELQVSERALREDWGIQPNGAWAHKAIPQLTERLESLGAALTDRTPTGRAQLTQGVLKRLVASGGKPGELAQAVREAQEAKHFRTYIETFQGCVGRDGRVHATINPLAAVTGRMSVNNPALQQLPKKDKRLRGCFIADEGQAWVAVDYAAIEVRMAGALSREHRMLDVLRRETPTHKVDLYAPIAEMIGGKDWTDDDRALAKVGILGPMYGSGARTLAKQTGITMDKAYEVIRAVDKAYPELRKFARRVTEHAENGNLEAKSFTGRPLMIDGSRPYAGFNTLIQGPARDVMAMAYLRLCDAGMRDSLRLLVHDEADASFPKADAHEAAEEMRRIMSTTFKEFPLSAEAQVLGDRWKKA